MLKRGVRLFAIIISFIMLFSISELAYAKNGNRNNGNKNQTKKVLVKYRDKDSKREDKLNAKKDKQKLKKYQKVNKNNLYSIEIEDSELATLLNDNDIELVEEDSIIQLLCNDHQTTCSDINHAIQIFNEDSEEDNEAVEAGEHEEHVHGEEEPSIEHWNGGLCHICLQPACNEDEECVDTIHYLCNNCIIDMLGYKPIEDKSNEPLKELDTGYDSIYSSLGDKIPWNILRTKSHLLHDNNVKGGGIRVAVFDTGIDLNHNELNVVGGVSFVEGVTSYDDDNGHGTAMAGIIAAKINGQGMVGIAPDVDLYSVKVMDQNGIGRYSNIIQGINWAIENDINIITLSLGGTLNSKILYDAIEEAIQNNILIVAAAGNGEQDQIMYPAAYPQVICVGATNSSNELATYSNYGLQLDIVAPGINVVTTGLNNKIHNVSGTSSATQHVAGVAALLWSADKDLTNEHIKYLLYNNTYYNGDYSTYGYRLLNAETAYINMRSEDYSIYISENGEEQFIEGITDIGWDGVIYMQGCNHSYAYRKVAPTCTIGVEGEWCIHCGECLWYTTLSPVLNCDLSNYYEEAGHTSDGHEYGHKCSRCGSKRKEGYKSFPTCLSCNTAPSISFANITGNTILSEVDTDFKPQIKVFDNENDTLTCEYHLDGSNTPTGTITVTGTKPEKTVAFTTGFNAANLSEGNHTIKATAKDKIAPKGETTITFKVDKSAPSISNLVVTPATNNVKLTVTASDSISGLASAAYRYTVNGVATGWLSAGTYTKTGLIPNTSYSYKVEVRDNKGHIATRTGSFNTTVEKPVVSVTALHENNIQIVINDNNPASTQYRIKVGSGYANIDGAIVSNESFITIPYDASVNGKRIVVSNLSPNTSYTVTVSAKNTSATEIVTATSVSAVTSPAAPSNIAVTSVTYNQISLQWQAVAGAVQYEIFRERLDEQGNLIEAHTKTISTNYLYDNDLLSEQDYSYCIRSINQSGIHGIWSSPKTQVRTPNELPEMVSGVLVSIDGSSLAISWNEITDVVGYEIEIIYDGNVETLYTSENQITLDTNIFNCQCSIKVKAYNRCDKDEPDNTDLWTNEGEWSDSVLIYTSADIPALSLVEDKITPNSVTVSWDIGQNPVSVRYLLSMADINNTVEIPVLGTSAIDGIITYLVTGLEPETSYDFKVKAFNAVDMDTEWSKQVNAVTLIDYPAIPARLRATAKSDRVSLFWDPADNAQSYILEKDGVILVKNWLETSYVDTNVLPDKEYNYRVKAANTTGESDWSLSLNKKTLGNVPVSPTITFVTGSSISVTIEWETSETVSGYELEADGEIYNVGLNTMFEHNGLIPGTSHVYAVRSRNMYGRSEWSNFVTYKTRNLIPDIPTILQVIPSDEQISVLWSAVDGAEYYEIEINGIITGSTSSLGYQVFIHENNSDTDYALRIRAVNESGNGGWTAPYPVILPDDGGSIPDIPTPSTPQLACSVEGSAKVFMEWDSVTNASYYQLEADNSIIYTGTETRYIHTGNLPNSQHSYRVRAGNLSGQSQWSEPVIAVTGMLYDTTPQNISYFRVNDEATKIVWDQVVDITDYVVRVNSAVTGSAIVGTSLIIPTEPGELYNVQVASVVNEGDTEYLDWSDEITFRTPRKLPGIPENVNFVVTSDSITITWDEVINAQGYEVKTFRGNYDVGNSRTYVITGLDPSSSYNISLRAYNEAGVGVWSESYGINTLDETPGVPANILCYSYQSEDNLRGSSILIQWDNVRRATSYEVEDSNGNIYETNTNEIIIDDLNAGTTYLFRVRALSKNTAGAWSSWIYIIPIVDKPGNVSASMVEDKIQVSWKQVSINDLYEIEIDGVSIETTQDLSHEFDYPVFYLQRKIRVRALRDHMAGIWSEEVEFGQPLPIKTSVYDKEEFSVLLPATNVELGSHKITLTYNTNEVELIDACEITADADIATGFIEELKTHIIIENDGDMVSITFLVDDSAGISYSGIINSIRLRSKVTGDITLHYGVTLR